MKSDNSKYQEYMASREWALKREAVRARSGGICERCKINSARDTHHLTYENLYHEPLEDLQHVCGGCHEFLSAKTDHDPAKLFVLPGVESFYLAGKITENNWRDEILVGWSFQNHSPLYRDGGSEQINNGEWAEISDAIKLPDGRGLAYRGPFWSDAGSGGHGESSYEYEDGTHQHAFDPRSVSRHGDEGEARRILRGRICVGIGLSDLIFAWIDSPECYGTLIEIGYARGCFNTKHIAVAFKQFTGAKELWLASEFATINLGTCESAGAAWKKLWDIETSPAMSGPLQ